MIDKIKIRGARVHNLKNINVDVPLNTITAIAGVSGSGKSSLALGVLYAEGSRRYLEALSTYTRRRMTQAVKAQVDEVLYVPAALALHQRPGVPGIRSTFGTGTELFNSLRLMFSRLASHRCPNGHYVPPTLAVAAEQQLTCLECGARFWPPGAEELAFNSQGACRTCDGTGLVRNVDLAALVPDESLTIDEGAVAPWNTLMWSLMTDVCRAMGVRTNVPFRDLTPEEKEIVYHGPAEKKHIFYKAKSSNQAGELDFTYYNAVYTVQNALAKVKDEKGMKRVEKFLKQETCPDCGGTRLSDAARAPRLRGIGLDEACRMTLTELTGWVNGVPGTLPPEMRPMAASICESFQTAAKRLMDLGPEAGAKGGQVIAEGTVAEIAQNKNSKIGPFLKAKSSVIRKQAAEEKMFAAGRIHLETGAIHTVKPLAVDIPKGRLTVVTGVSGSGKTTLILESLVPGLTAATSLQKLPEHVLNVQADGIRSVKLIDATPIGINVRSTIATYANVHDELRKIFARTEDAKTLGFKAGDFSYNTGKLRCPTCDGTGVINLDVQFLPDVEIPCPDCRGSRYGKDAAKVKYCAANGQYCSLPDLMDMDISTALTACADLKTVRQRLQVLTDLGLGYLTLGEETPSLSGGEAQRLKLASEMGKSQNDAVFIFDEPTIGLHPLDVRTLLDVFQRLIDSGATVIVIEHDLDVIRNADYIIDMGPGGGNEGGTVVACGTPAQIKAAPASVTGKFI